MSKPKQFTPHEKAYITRAHSKGYGIWTIARGLQCASKRVRNHLRSAGASLHAVNGMPRDLPPLTPYGGGKRSKAQPPLRLPKPEKPQPATHPWHDRIAPGWRIHGEVRYQ